MLRTCPRPSRRPPPMKSRTAARTAQAAAWRSFRVEVSGFRLEGLGSRV